MAPLAILMVLTGCGDNPLLGNWTYMGSDKTLPVIYKKVVYTSDREACGSITQEVEYEVLDNTVNVKQKQASGLLNEDMIYDIVSAIGICGVPVRLPT